MACDVYLTAQAERDRDGIVAYLLHRLGNRQAAGHFLDELDNLVGLLEHAPEMFPFSRDDYLAALGLRVAPCMRYVVLYRVRATAVYVEHIFHGSRDYARLV